MVLTVRPLNAGDVRIWRALVNELAEVYPHILHTSAEEARSIPEACVAAKLEGGDRLGVFDDDGDCLGLAALTVPVALRARHRRCLEKFYIRPHAYWSDAGDRLMTALLSNARRDGATQIEFTLSSEAKPRTHNFFLRFGFEEVGRLPAAIVTENGPVDNLIYVLKLSETARPGPGEDQSRSSVTMRSGATSMYSSSPRIASIIGSGPQT